MAISKTNKVCSPVLTDKVSSSAGRQDEIAIISVYITAISSSLLTDNGDDGHCRHCRSAVTQAVP